MRKSLDNCYLADVSPTAWRVLTAGKETSHGTSKT